MTQFIVCYSLFQKELEKALQKAAEATKKAKVAEVRLSAAQSTAIKLRHQVTEQRHAVEQAEMEAATMASIAEQRSKPQAAFPSSGGSFGYQQYNQSDRNEVHHDANTDCCTMDNTLSEPHYDDGYTKSANQSLVVENGKRVNTNMTDWGMGVGKPSITGDNYGGIPSPTNSVNGDANPFTF